MTLLLNSGQVAATGTCLAGLVAPVEAVEAVAVAVADWIPLASAGAERD